MIHGYLRVSTEGQVDGSSPEEQERRIRAIAAAQQIPEENPRIWCDTISGSIPVNERPNGARMIEALQRGDTIIAAKLDRLFRNAEDALARSRVWREEGIDLVLADMGVDPVTTSASGRMYFGMLAQFAEFERERIRERISEGKASKRARGGFIGGHAPIGFRAEGTGRDAVIRPDEKEREMITAVKRLADQLGSPTKVAARLNELGYHSRAGTPIVAAQVWRWLR